MADLFLDCGMGAAGDMLMAALYEVLSKADQARYLEEINNCGIPGVSVIPKITVRCGIAGTIMEVLPDTQGESGKHSHSTLAQIAELIDASAFSAAVKKNARKIYGKIAEAEAIVHGTTASQVHFHEVGRKAAVVNILGVCRLMEMLAPERVYASPIRLGYGQVKCAHGILSVPAPATAILIQGLSVYAGDIEGEMLTPTGAALLSFFVDEFTQLPAMTIDRCGYGMGKRDFERAGCVRSFISSDEKGRDEVIELSTNLDDMTGEALAYAEEQMRQAGALEVYTIPIYMKKNRPGVILSVLCNEEDEEKLINLFLANTTTWGIRRRVVERIHMNRSVEIAETSFGPVRIKHGTYCGISKFKPEYDDCAEIARKCNMSIMEVTREIEYEISKHE